MRNSTNFGLPLAALLLAVVLIPSSGWAGTGSVTKNCPVEPATNVPIVSGLTYWGTNCVLKTTGDVDSFVFTAAAGDIWNFAFGPDAASTTEICLSLYDPAGNLIVAPLCIGSGSYLTSQKLTVAGTYTIVMKEVTTNTVISYGLSLERISPAPPDGIPLVLSKTVTGEVNPPTAMDAYTFCGVTTGTYQATVSVSGQTHEVCFAVYQPDGTITGTPLCFAGTTSYSAGVKPTKNGTLAVLVWEAGGVGTVSYNVDVSCLLGTCTCTPPPPTCKLTDAPTYSAATDTLTMKFTVATPVAATWDGWLINHNTATQLWSQSQPITEPAVTTTKMHSLAASGEVGILSTLTIPTNTTTTGGITCNSWVLVNTGKP